MDFKKHYKSLNRWLYLTIALGIQAFVFVMSSVLHYPKDTLLYLFISLLLYVLCFFAYKKADKLIKEREFSNNPNDLLYQKLFDKYSRRLISWLLIAFLLIFSFILKSISLGINSKISELLESFTFNLFAFEIVALSLIKNVVFT